MSNAIELRRFYWASVSGDKDSLYMLNLILHIAKTKWLKILEKKEQKE